MYQNTIKLYKPKRQNCKGPKPITDLNERWLCSELCHRPGALPLSIEKCHVVKEARSSAEHYERFAIPGTKALSPALVR